MRKILVVEDETILRDTYQLLLSTQPYDVHIAENGEDALGKCQENTYDLILLDLMMPVLDGVGFLSKFKPTDTMNTKVIILSNLSFGKELDEAISLGAERNVLKSSLSPKELLSLIRYELPQA